MRRTHTPAALFVALLVTLFVSVLPALGAVFAQDAGQPARQSPISLRTEIYIVSLVTRDDGTREERFSPATEAIPGQVIEYRIFATNTGETTLPAGSVQIYGPVENGMEYVSGSATPTSDRVLAEFSLDGAEFGTPPLLVGTGESRRVAEPEEYKMIRWRLLVDLEPGQEAPFYYRVTLL